jgi:fructose-1,6-bisphosphatase
MVISPDVGGVVRARAFAKHLPGAEMAIIDKRRPRPNEAQVLHIIGDVFDRGSGVHNIMVRLMDYHSVDFQWGNHDILWMGAYTGSLPCIASAVRMSLRYGIHELLDEDYGINLLPLAKFAMATYDEVEDVFMPLQQNLLDVQD